MCREFGPMSRNEGNYLVRRVLRAGVQSAAEREVTVRRGGSCRSTWAGELVLTFSLFFVMKKEAMWSVC